MVFAFGSDIEGPFQVDGLIRKTTISNVAGPFRTNGSSGTIILTDILWNADGVWPFNIGQRSNTAPYMISTTGNIDITLPEDLKATVSLSPKGGQVYSDLNLIQVLKSTVILNGGGINIFTNVRPNSSVYLRKQKK